MSCLQRENVNFFQLESSKQNPTANSMSYQNQEQRVSFELFLDIKNGEKFLLSLLVLFEEHMLIFD